MKTIEEITSKKPDPSIQAKIISAKRQSTAEDLLKEVAKKYPLPNKDTKEIPVGMFRHFCVTQAVMMPVGIYLSIDWDKMEYYALDLQLGKEYR